MRDVQEKPSRVILFIRVTIFLQGQKLVIPDSMQMPLRYRQTYFPGVSICGNDDLSFIGLDVKESDQNEEKIHSAGAIPKPTPPSRRGPSF